MEQMINPEYMVFGLDIGTRSIVGTVGYKLPGETFTVTAQYSKEHETRAMMDGQIHDIGKVADSIRVVKEKLEEMIGSPLTKVCIAAAGRILKTTRIHSEYEFQMETVVTEDHLHTLEMLAIEKSYTAIREETKNEKRNFYCVGSSVLRYYLNGYEMQNLIGHKAEKIEMELLSTYLPEEVIEGLYIAVEQAGLEVMNLTLEPIAAISVAIPEKYRLLNIAMVDVGAGTSDICITKDGAIIAYGMIPFAGDEITEAIQKNFLVDFNTAEKLKMNCLKEKVISYKDAFSVSKKVHPSEVLEVINPTIEQITKDISDKITQLNGRAVSAVFVVGGGGRIPGFCEKIAKYMELQPDRVAVRGADVLKEIKFTAKGAKKDSLMITPIGICVNYFERQNKFIYVNVNRDRVKLYDTGKLTIVDAAIMAGFPNERLFPRRGASINYTMNQEEHCVKGGVGESAIVKLNGETVSMNEAIKHNDVIEIIEATMGSTPQISVDKLRSEYNRLIFYIEEDEYELDPICMINGKLASGGEYVKDQDNIEILDYYTLDQVLQAFHVIGQHKYFVNGEEADRTRKVYHLDHITIREEASSLSYRQNVSTATNQNMNNMTGSLQMQQEQNWMNEIPSGNHLTAISNQMSSAGENHFPMEPSMSGTSKMGTFMSTEHRNEVEDQKPLQTKSRNDVVFITVNKEVVKLMNKPSYIVVDILDFYPFDMSRGGSSSLVISVNGLPADFTTPIKDNDHVELYWK